MENEYILHAAVKIDISNGGVFSGKHHGDCFEKIRKASQQGEQGFIADSYSGTRFVDRKEALEIAIAAGQNIDKHNPKDVLLSEDLKNDKLFCRNVLNKE